MENTLGTLQGIIWQESEVGTEKGSRREKISEDNFGALTTWRAVLAVNGFT